MNAPVPALHRFPADLRRGLGTAVRLDGGAYKIDLDLSDILPGPVPSGALVLVVDPLTGGLTLQPYGGGPGGGSGGGAPVLELPPGGAVGQVLKIVAASPRELAWAADNIASGNNGLVIGTTSGTAAEGNDPRIVGAMQKASNGADIPDKPAFRNALALGAAALLPVGTAAGTVAAGDDGRITGALQAARNGSDIPDRAAFRTALTLKGAALLDVGTASGTVAAGDDARFGLIPSRQWGERVSAQPAFATNHDTAMDQAIAAAVTSGSRCVLVDAPLTLNAGHILPQQFTLAGVGNRPIITTPSTNDYVFRFSDYGTIRNLRFPRGESTGPGICLLQQIDDANTAASVVSVIEGCLFTGWPRAIVAVNGEQLNVVHNQFINCTTWCVHLLSRAYGSTIRNNVMLGCNGVCVERMANSDRQCEGVRIDSNDIYATKEGQVCIRFIGGLDCSVVRNCLGEITANGAGLIIDGATNGQVTEMTVDDNWFGSGGTATNVTGLLLTGQVNDLRIMNNKLSCARMRLESGSGKFTYGAQIWGNNWYGIKNAASALVLQNCIPAIVWGNSFSDGGIEENSIPRSDSNSTIRVFENWFGANAAPIVRHTNSVYHDNIGPSANSPTISGNALRLGVGSSGNSQIRVGEPNVGSLPTNAGLAIVGRGTGKFTFQNGSGVQLTIGGGSLGFNGNEAGAKPEITGSQGGNAALGSLINALTAMGLITNSTN